MKYWDKNKKSLADLNSSILKLELQISPPDIGQSLINYAASKPGSSRKLSLEPNFSSWHL